MTCTRALRVQAEPGITSTATLYSSDGDTLIILLPAMGAPARFYRPLASALVGRGVSVVVGELRGVGTSSVRAQRDVDFGYYEHVMIDVPALVHAARRACPGARVVLAGHSLGGHVALAHSGIDASVTRSLVLIAAGTPFFRLWPAPIGYGLLTYAHAIRVLSDHLGYFPGRHLGFGDIEPRRYMSEWTDLVQCGDFVVRGRQLDVEAALSSVDTRVLSLSFPGDLFATEPAIEHLLAKIPNADIERRRFTRRDFDGRRVGHFRWMRRAPLVADAIAQFCT